MYSETQKMNKRNKVSVPFYSPPYRLNGQTSADIIKEARAAVMIPPPVGIKPVYTSRPFTPNEKERKLFGKATKATHRPPSSFSLGHLRSQETSSGVKLPSINIVSRRKNYSTFHYSKNLSLDNLTEDYDGEVFEEGKSTDPGKLLTWKKSHSCPKEGRLSKVSSLNDLNHPLIKRVNEIKQSEGDYLTPQKEKGFKTNEKSYDLNVSKVFGDCITTEEEIVRQKNPLMTHGGGDYDVTLNAADILEKDSSDEKINEPEEAEQKVDQSKAEVVEEKHQEIEKSTEEAPQESTQQKKDVEKEQPETKQVDKNSNVSEKSISTGFKSEYLTSLRDGHKNTNTTTNKEPEALPKEILELYETANYYGVDVNHNENTNKNAIKKEENLMKTQSAHSKLSVNNSKTQSKKDTVVTQKSTNQENIQFVMNDKRRDHIVAVKNNTKAYKKWNDKVEEKTVTPSPPETVSSSDVFWKSSYFRNDSAKTETKDQGNLLRTLKKIAGLANKDPQTIYEATSELYGMIKNKNGLLDKKLKEDIIRALYLFVDNENAQVLLSIAKILYSLKEENSLSVACKIIFKVARFDVNDLLFLNEEDVLELFLEGIGRAPPLDCAESCIYSYGALKFLTLNHNILSRILHIGALDLMTLHLKMINNAYEEKGFVGEQTQHALFQLTGALRHIAAGEGALPLFLTTNCIAIICSTLQHFSKDEDVVINISRTLSLLSTDEIVTQALMKVDNILGTLIDLMERYKENDKILIRLAFCLGNIVEHSDLARVQLSRSEATLTVLLNVLKLYIDKDLEASLKDNTEENNNELDAEVIDDVIVKVIRIIANMSMNPIVGSNLSPATKEKKSLRLSKLLSVLLLRKDPGITLLATLGCLNNISYYCNSHSALIDITQGVERVLGLESAECQTEAARVLGNLTRHREIRDLIYSTGGVNLLIKLLSSTDQEVVRCACGALVNMLLDLETRNFFVKAQGVDKLTRTLEVFSGDWSLASLAARAIWNACGDDVPTAMQHNNVENLLNFLASALEEENWNDGDVAWEEFASVATDLLEKISSHLEPS